MKRSLTSSHLILSLLALASAQCLSAQTLVVDKPSLSLSGQFGGPAVTQTVNITSSTGASIPFILVAPPGSPWLKVSGQGVAANTPSAVTVTADPTGLAAGSYSANISVIGGSAASNPPIAVNFTVSAIGVSPASVPLTYTVGSSTFPATQVLTLSGTPTQCTATPAISSGGGWFSLLQNSCTSPGSVTVLFNTAVIAGLAPNTYNGTVTITPVPGQSPAVVVPITLTVLPTPPVTVNPQSLIFNWQTGIAAPNPSQTFTISTTGTQQLSYSFTTFVDTGNWISTVSPPSGTFTGSTQITVTLNPNGLALGTYNGKLTLFTPGATPSQQDIPVRLVVGNTALLNVPNATLNFVYQLGTSAPPAQNVNITATNGALNYAVSQSANSSWLSVPNAGNTAAPLPVSVNPSGLSAGTYSATVNVVSATPGSLAQQFPVVLKITNDPVVSANLSSITFSYQIGQAAPIPRNVKVTSTTGVPLNYTAAVDLGNCTANWLTLNGGSTSVNGVTDSFLTVNPVVTGGFGSPTSCTGAVTINATNPATGAPAVGSPISIPIVIYASATAQLLMSPPDPPVFTAGVGTQSPPAQNITLTSTDSTVLNYTVAFQSNTGNWLFAGPQSGTTAANNVLTLSVIPSGLTAGTYTGTVTVTATGPGGAAVANSPITIPVKLIVTAVSLTISNSDLSFEQTLGGPLPAAQTVTVGSTGQALSYTAVANSNSSVNWLSVTPASGTTGGSISVSVDGSQLTPGTTYNGTIVVTAPGAGNSPSTINVHLKVNAGTISAPTTTLTFTQAAGGSAPPAQTIAVTGSPAALNFTVTSSTQNGVSWLGATPASGTTPGSIQVIANGPTLGVGQYTGTVTIASAGATGSPISVPVVLNVVAPATLAVTPTSLSFTYTVGQPAPPAQSLALSSGSAVPFTTQVQIDGTATGWLTVTPASGNTPAGLSVSVSPAALAAGSYTGRVVITSPNAITPLTVPVTLAVVVIPKPVVVAVKNAANYFPGNLSPGENIVIGGTGLGPVTLTLGAIVNNSYTTTVANTRILFDNVPAPIIYVSDSLTSVMVPYGVGGRTSTSIVVEYFGVQSTPVIYNIGAASPGIYTLNSSGSGPGAILNQNGAVNGPNAPEKRGNVIAVYMTGEGATTPAGVDGLIIAPVASALKKPLLTVTATIGGIAADVQYAGSAPGLVSGIMQVNLLIPPNAPVGANVPIVVNVGTASSAGAGAPTVAIQ